MVATSIPNDVAIELSDLLTTANVYHVLFGEWIAIIEGCGRVKKDLDCYTATTKQDAVTLFQIQPC